MPEADRSSARPLRGALARLERDRDALAKAWLMRIIERASLGEISDLPTARIAAELPELISEVLALASGEGVDAATGDSARARAERIIELRDSRSLTAVEVSRDVTALQLVILEALRHDAGDLEPAGVAELAAGVADAAAGVQEAAVESLMSRRASEQDSAAGTDPLTGLGTLRSLQHEIGRALALHKRYDHPFGLLALDVDGLRQVNDSQGTQAGDRVLVQVALAIRRTIRSVDLPARIGGDEFCLLVPEGSSDSARTLGLRLAEAVRLETSTPDGPGVGVAIGVVACPEHGEDVSALLEAADGAMYRAKAGGEAVAVGTPAEPEITVKRST